MRDFSSKAVVTAIVAAVVGLTASAGAFGSAGAGETVVARWTGDWTTFDFQVDNANFDPYVTAGYDRLVAVADGKVLPYLATSWKLTPKSATFALRKGARCANGNLMTPNAVARSFQRLFTVPKRTTNLGQFLGPGPFSASADSSRWTVTIRSQTPFRGLLTGLGQAEAGIVCPSGLASPDQLQANWLGSGPYGLVSAVHGDQVVLKKRAGWTWGPVVNGRPTTAKDLPDVQVWKIVTNDTTAANLLLTNDLDLAGINGPDVARLRGASALTLKEVPIQFPHTLVFNHGSSHVTANDSLRAALMTAVDPKAYNAVALQGAGTPVTSFILPGQECFDPKTKELYPAGGTAKAKQILTQAGYTGVGSNLVTPAGKPVKLKLVTSSASFGSSGEYLANVFQQLGVDVTLADLVGSARSQALFRGDFDVSVTSTTLTTTQVAVHMSTFVTANKTSLNLFGPSPQQNAEWNRLMRLGSQRIGAAGCKYYVQAQELALKQHLFLPLVSAPRYIFARKGVTFSAGLNLLDPTLIRKS